MPSIIVILSTPKDLASSSDSADPSEYLRMTVARQQAGS